MAAAKKPQQSFCRRGVPGPYSSRVPTSPGEVRLPAGSRGRWLTFGSWTFHKKGRGGFQDFRAAIPFLETFPIGSMVLVYIC